MLEIKGVGQMETFFVERIVQGSYNPLELTNGSVAHSSNAGSMRPPSFARPVRYVLLLFKSLILWPGLSLFLQNSADCAISTTSHAFFLSTILLFDPQSSIAVRVVRSSLPVKIPMTMDIVTEAPPQGGVANGARPVNAHPDLTGNSDEEDGEIAPAPAVASKTPTTPSRVQWSSDLLRVYPPRSADAATGDGDQNDSVV